MARNRCERTGPACGELCMHDGTLLAREYWCRPCLRAALDTAGNLIDRAYKDRTVEPRIRALWSDWCDAVDEWRGDRRKGADNGG